MESSSVEISARDAEFLANLAEQLGDSSLTSLVARAVDMLRTEVDLNGLTFLRDPHLRG